MKKLILMLALVVLSTSVYAEQILQSNTIYLDPFYHENFIQDVEYSFDLDVDTPTGIYQVKSAMIKFDVYISPTSSFTLKVDNQSCTPPTFLVHTTYANAHFGSIAFDCSNVITQEGIYNVTMLTDDDTGATYGWLEITYMTEPLTGIEVFGTEYEIGEQGTTFIQLLNNDNEAINDATCYASIWYPDKTSWITNSIMMYLNGSNGLYYLDFTAQSQQGIYMIDAYCNYETSDIFHNTTGYSLIQGTYLSGDNASIQESDDIRLTITETSGISISGDQEPILYAKFDETSGTVASDSSGNGDGLYVNSPDLTISGISNTGINLDGINDYVRFDGSNFVLNSSEEIMICLAINTGSNLPNGVPIIDFDDGNDGFAIYGADDEIEFNIDRSGSGQKDMPSITQLDDSDWHKVCFWSGFSEMRVYVDGVLDDTDNPAQSGVVNDVPTYLYVGRNQDGNEFSDDYLDEVCIYKGVDINYTGIVAQYNSSNKCPGVGDGASLLDIEITIEGLLANETIENFNVFTEYQWDDNVENINAYIYNYGNSSWELLTNELTFATTDSIISSTIYANHTDYISGGESLIKYNTTIINDTTVGTFKIDYVTIIDTILVTNPVSEIRGGGEIHVTNHSEYVISELSTEIDQVATEVWSHSPRTLTYYPPAEVNVTPILDGVWNYSNRTLTNLSNVQPDITNAVWGDNYTIDVGLLSQFVGSVWDYVARYTHGIIT